MKLLTKKQEIQLRRKKMIRIAALSVTVVVAGVFVYLFFTRDFFPRPMDPQVNYLLGDCRYRKTSSNAWDRVAVGMKVEKDYEFATGNGSMMDILFQDDAAVRLMENSRLNVALLMSKKVEFSLGSGEIFGKINRLFKGQEMNIRTSTVIAGVRGTQFCVTTGAARKKDRAESSGYCLSGSVDFAPPGGKPVRLEPHKKSSVTAGSGPVSPEQMTAGEINRMQTVLDSIQLNRVLLVTSKLLFKPGSDEISGEMEPELRKILDSMKSIKGTIRIIGHTDSAGDAESNRSLSLRRAKSIRGYMAKRGLPSERLEAIGEGASKPAASNNTDEGRAMNRRVEFVIVK